MKRTSKIKSSAYSIVSTNVISQNLVYMHMSSHYRRLMNAKSQVDSSLPPRRCQAPRTLPVQTKRLTIDNDDLDLADQIAFDVVNGPAAYCSTKLSPPTSRRRSPNKKHPSRQFQASNYAKPVAKRQPRPPADLMEQHPESFEQHGRKFNPRVLKTDAESRVRQLPVYHPPRRQATTRTRNDWAEDTPLHDVELVEGETMMAHLDDQWLLERTADSQTSNAVCNQCGHGNPLHSSKVSTGSRDSAYNGGISSGADSRGPTPEQIPLVKPTVQRLTSADKFRTIAHAQQNDDTLYAAFSHHITEDILLRGIFSDRGMNAVFQRHIEENKLKLDMSRMKEEIANLRVQLGITDKDDVGLSRSKFPTTSSSVNCVASNASTNSNIDNQSSDISVNEKILNKKPSSGTQIGLGMRNMQNVLNRSVSENLSRSNMNILCNVSDTVLDKKISALLAGRGLNNILDMSNCSVGSNVSASHVDNLSNTTYIVEERTVSEKPAHEMDRATSTLTATNRVKHPTSLSECEREHPGVDCNTSLGHINLSTSREQGLCKPKAMPRTIIRGKTVGDEVETRYQLQGNAGPVSLNEDFKANDETYPTESSVKGSAISGVSNATDLSELQQDTRSLMLVEKYLTGTEMPIRIIDQVAATTTFFRD